MPQIAFDGWGQMEVESRLLIEPDSGQHLANEEVCRCVKGDWLRTPFPTPRLIDLSSTALGGQRSALLAALAEMQSVREKYGELS